MAAASGRKAAVVMAASFDPAPQERPLEHLMAHPQSFAQGQALRLLGMTHFGDYAAWLRFMQGHVRVRSWLSLAFPATELADIRRTDEGDTPDQPSVLLTGTGFGLYGTMGPLPTFYTEELLEEARHDESVSRDFLDILNIRLNHCLHLVTLWRKLYQRETELGDPRATHVLHCLMGQAYAGLRPEGPPQVAVLRLLLQHTRSAMGLEEYCTHALGVAGEGVCVRVEQCVRRVAAIPQRQRCRLGEANATLGQDAVLGEQIEDHAGKFRLHLEGLSREGMARFLPFASGYAELQGHVRRFLDVPLEFDVVLHPECEPGEAGAFRQRLGAPLGGYVFVQEGPLPPVTIYQR